MQYFKHMTNMRNDIKIKRLISKYGLEGYGLYNLILESITESLTTDAPVPDLQETCEDIAEFFNGNTAKINEMASFMVNQGLIEVDEITTRITCNKIYKYLEQSMTRSKAIRDMISAYKTSDKVLISVQNGDVIRCHDMSETIHDKSDRIEENRIEENRIEEERINNIKHAKKEMKHKYGEYKHVLLTDKEYNKLVDLLGNKHDVDCWIKKMDEAIEMKGYKYKSHYLAILKWYKNEKENNKPQKSKYDQEIPNL